MKISGLKTMWKLYCILFTFSTFLFFSCNKKGHLIYIRMPDNAIIADKFKVRVLFRGVQIGEIREKANLLDNHILLTASIYKTDFKSKFTGAVYREDLLGNTYVELIAEEYENGFKNREPSLDTLYGVFSPLYHKVDSASEEKILKEIGNFKKKLDSILKHR